MQQQSFIKSAKKFIIPDSASSYSCIYYSSAGAYSQRYISDLKFILQNFYGNL